LSVDGRWIPAAAACLDSVRQVAKASDLFGELSYADRLLEVAVEACREEQLPISLHCDSIFVKLGIAWEKEIHKRVKAVILYLAEGR
jgi:hypothetical protein